MLPAVRNGTQDLAFNILNALPPVTEDEIIWSFRPTGAAESSVIDETTSDRYSFTFVEDADPPYVRLRIHPVELEDEGNYTLSVENMVGNDSFTVSVEVFSKSLSLSLSLLSLSLSY